MDSLQPYRLPAEWEKHESTWLSWPHNPDTWPYQLSKVQDVHIEFIKAISQGERVNLLINNENAESISEKLVSGGCDINQIIVHNWKTNDAWIRDYGPDFLISEEKKVILDWKYNAWGEKYPPYDADNLIPERVSYFLGMRSYSPHFVLEGGSFDPNGQGSILTTTSCLLNKNRNPNYSIKEIEGVLKSYLQVENIIWLEEGIIGDDTDGHIDDISRFVNNDTILTCIEENRNDDNYAPLQINLKLLQKARLENGKQPTIVELPMPKPFYYKSERLPASYANFYICNHAVIVPVFNDKNDDKALNILASLFPDRKIIPIYSGDIIYGLGSFHCLSKHEPALL